jgi:hypothetical protein
MTARIVRIEALAIVALALAASCSDDAGVPTYTLRPDPTPLARSTIQARSR